MDIKEILNLTVHTCWECSAPATHEISKDGKSIHVCDVHVQNKDGYRIVNQFIVRLNNEKVHINFAIDSLRTLITKHVRFYYRGRKCQAIIDNFDIGKWAFFGTLTHGTSNRGKGDWVIIPINQIIRIES